MVLFSLDFIHIMRNISFLGYVIRMKFKKCLFYNECLFRKKGCSNFQKKFSSKSTTNSAQFSWSVFSRIWIEYGDLLCKYPHFPAFGLITEIYSVNARIHSECGEIRTRKTPNTNTFYAVQLQLVVANSFKFLVR